MERVENRYFDLQGLHQVNRLDISSVLWSLGVKNKTPCWESGVSKFKIFQTKQTKAKFSLRNKHWQKYRYIKWRKETQPLHSLMLFSAGSRFRISHSFTKSVFFFPLPSAIVLQMLFLRSGEKTLYRKHTAAGGCGIIVPGTDSHVVALNTKTVISSILKNVPLFNCSIIKNSCAFSSQTNVSVMWENKLFFFFPPLSPDRNTDALQNVLPPTSSFSFHHCHFLRITFVPLEKKNVWREVTAQNLPNIASADPPWPVLSDKYKQRRKDKKLNPRTLRPSSVFSHIKSSHVSCFVP